MNYKKLDKKLAFSLLELSVVLIIVAGLMVAVVKGSDVISQAKISSARDKTIRSPVWSIKGVYIWYETTMAKSLNASEVKDNGEISTWFDISGNNPTNPSNATQSLTLRPRYIENGINGLPAIKFDGINDYLSGTISSPINSTQLEVFIVAKRFAVKNNSSAVVLYKDGSGNDNNTSSSVVVAYEGSTATSLQTFRNSVALSTGTHPGNNIPYIFSTRFDGTNNISYKNGVAQTTVVSTGNFDIDRVFIGARYESAFTNYYNGNIGELIIFDRVLSDQERADVVSYLISKWGIK